MQKLAVASLVAAVAVAPSAHAAFPIEVTALDLGSCWMQEQPQPPPSSSIWQIASWGSRIAVQVTPWDFEATVNPQIDALLKKTFPSFAAGTAETAVYCFTDGHFFMSYIPSTTKNLCVWSKYQPDPKTGQQTLTVLSVNPEYNPPAPGSNCWGANRKSLIAGVSSGIDANSVAGYLNSSARYRGVIASASQIGTSGILVIKLTDKFDFREDEAKASIDRDPALAGKLAYTEYDGMAAVSGEAAMILKTDYPGYSGR